MILKNRYPPPTSPKDVSASQLNEVLEKMQSLTCSNGIALAELVQLLSLTQSPLKNILSCKFGARPDLIVFGLICQYLLYGITLQTTGDGLAVYHQLMILRIRAYCKVDECLQKFWELKQIVEQRRSSYLMARFCQVCRVHVVNILNLPCGHAVLCSGCAEAQMHQCISCRITVLEQHSIDVPW